MPQGKKAAMLSYNTFLRGQPNGWLNESLFVIQNENGQKWAAPQNVPIPKMFEEQVKGDQLVQNTVQGHWQQLSDQLPSFNHVVIYVGDRGSEHTIKHAAEHKLDPAKAIFVMCSCNIAGKENTIRRHGFGNSKLIACECGGQQTMQRMAERFIATGEMTQ